MNDRGFQIRSSSLSPAESYIVPHRPLQVEGKPIDEVLSFGHYIILLKRHGWKISLTVIATTLLTIIYCNSVQPLYEATTRITVDQRNPTTAIGQQASPAAATEVDQMMLTEIQIIQSDAVLRPVAEQFQLLNAWKPSRLSTVLMQLHLSGYAQRLHLVQPPEVLRSSAEAQATALREAPVVFSNLSVGRLPSSLLIDIRYRSPNPGRAARIANAIAESYLSRGGEMRAKSSMGLSTFMEKQIVELKKKMDDSSRQLAGYERELGVINPDEKTNILAARLLQLNTQYTEAANDRIRKETEYRAIHSPISSDSSNALHSAAIELSPEAAMLNREEERLHDAEEKFAVAKTVYGPNYAEYKRAANDVDELTRQCNQTRLDISKRIEVSYREAFNREAMLHTSLSQAKDESDQLNAHSSQYQELKREAEADKNLYDELYRKIKEAGINAGFEGSSIRIADEARPPAFPVFPKPSLFAAIAFILSLLGSVLVMIVADMFDKTLGDPEKANRLTGLQVIGALPEVRRFPQTHRASCLSELISHDEPERSRTERACISKEEYYSEAITTLLSTVLLSRNGPRPRSILITSSGPGEGKSTCAAHLALEHARLGKKTLLIDADLRSPFQQRYFDLTVANTRCWMITGDDQLSALRHKISDSPMLDVVFFEPAVNRNVFKHVGLKVSILLQRAAVEGYDLVVVDAPPMLGLVEPIEIAFWTDGVLVIGEAQKTTQRAIAEMVSSFDRVHARLLGLVLNRFNPESSESYKHYKTYSTYHRKLAKPATI